jgi:hypothetical protein
VVPPLNAAIASPKSAVSVLQSNTDITAPAPSGASVSKQNTAGVPKLHAASFQNFADVLNAALSRGDAPSYVEKGRVPGVDSGIPGAGRTPPLTKQLPISEQVGIAEQLHANDSGAPANSAPEASAAPKTRAAGRKDQKEITIASGASQRVLVFDLPLSRALGKVDVEPGSRQAQPQDNPNVNSIQVGNQPTQITQIQTENSDASSPDQLQAGRLNEPRSAGAPSQNERALTGPDFGISQSETQAFQLNLHSEPDLIEASHPTRSASETITNNASLAAPPVTEPPEMQAGEKFPQALETGNQRIEQSRQQTAATAALSDSRSASVPPTSTAALSRKDPVTASPDENKQGEKSPADAAPEPPKVWATAAPTALDSAVRVSGASRAPLEAPRSAETLRIGESATPNEAKEVLVRFQSGPAGTVTVRLVEQGGQIQVAVRSTDPVAAAQLRQDLGSLTNSLERYGWKTDLTPGPALQNPATHDAQPSRGNTQEGNQGRPDWNEGGENRRRSSEELWDTVFANQNA